MPRVPVSYDAETGIIIGANGRPCTSINSTGYITVRFMGKVRLGHHVAWYLTYGYFPERLDHKNQIRHDNRLDNLREVTSSQNAMNTPVKSTNTSGYRGVSMDKSGKWRATVWVKRKPYHFGMFENVHEAGEAARIGREQLHGEYISSVILKRI